MASQTLSLSLPEDMVRAVRARVDGGAYRSDSAVVDTALRDWFAREDRRAALDAAIDRAIADSDAGLGIPIDEARRRLLDRYRVTAV